jgi:deoxycytidine triphosphate deaminase
MNIKVRIRCWEVEMLTASKITEEIAQGQIAWLGELRGDGLLLTLGAVLQPLTDPGTIVDLFDQESINALYAEPIHDWDKFELAPGRMTLCSSGQPLRLGAAFGATIASLSHLARVGLATHVTSPWVMPGWDGHLTLELVNLSPATLRLHRDMAVARAVIWPIDGAAREPVPHAYYGRAEQLASLYADEFGSRPTMNDTRM